MVVGETGSRWKLANEVFNFVYIVIYNLIQGHKILKEYTVFCEGIYCTVLMKLVLNCKCEKHKWVEESVTCPSFCFPWNSFMDENKVKFKA